MSIHRDLETIDTDIQQVMSRVLENWFLSEAYRYEEDFFNYDIGDWTLTTVEAGAGDATEAIADEAGGVLLITNDAADDDSDEFQKVGEAFKLIAGKPLYFEARVKVSDAIQSDMIIGLCITDTTLLGGLSDGVYFIKDDGDANLDFVTEKNSTETKADTGVDLVNATYVILGFYWDGAGNVTPYVNGEAKTTHATNVPDDEELRVSFGIKNGEAVAKTMSVDYIKVVQKR